MFLKNVWYAAWWMDELTTSELHPRMIADQPLVFWRDDQGAAHAVLDRCPHRHAPLSMGRRVENGVQCGYHGLAFNGAGACIANPHGPIVPALHVRAFPLAERHNIIWIWMGDADRLDLDQIPDLGFADRAPSTAYSKGFLPTAAGHQLIIDNILDLTHADYLHASNLGGGAMTRAKPTIEVRPDSTLFVEWLVNGDVIPPFFVSELPHPDKPVDIWNSVLWHPNGAMKLRFGATTTGRPREEGIDTLAAHIATPETAHSTHYFYFNTRSFRLDDAEYTAQYAQAMRYAFSVEDKPMLEGQQRRLGDADLLDCKPVLLPTDAASTRARRVYAKLLKAENGEPKPAERHAVAAAG
jgi:phenylpropionate dioxygenase-like ring-hydroxylating dioxygenase large terminal subunit